MRKAAQQTGVESNFHNQDKGVGNLLTVTAPDDLFMLNIDVDLKKLTCLIIFLCNIFALTTMTKFSHFIPYQMMTLYCTLKTIAKISQNPKILIILQINTAVSPQK